MSSRPYHHNNLRADLLDRAEEMLRTVGADALSLRQLARQAGVSHGAPRSHFIDRQALLNALAERGFQELTRRVDAAIRDDEPGRARFRRVAQTYVTFAIEDAALMDLMFATKTTSQADSVQRAARGLFEVLDGALAPPSPQLQADDARNRFKVLFAATLQGTATLIATRRVSDDQADRLIADATDLLLDSPLARRVLPTETPHD